MISRWRVKREGNMTSADRGPYLVLVLNPFSGLQEFCEPFETFTGRRFLGGVRWGTPSKSSEASELATAQMSLGLQPAIHSKLFAVKRLSARNLTVFRQQFARSAVQ
jgi:hypothetical protein